jgi:2-aminoadipate transaminase
MRYNRLLASRSNWISESPLASIIAKISKLKSQGVRVISLAAGDPDPDLIPRDILAELSGEILNSYPSSVLYSPTTGLTELRKELSKFLMRIENLSIDYTNIVITIGGTGAIDLLGRVLIDPGDIIIMENPSYVNTILAFKQLGAKIYGVPIDDNGIKTEELEDIVRNALKDGYKIKFLYTIPTGHNPMGITMDIDRRKHVLEIASKYDLLVVEDAAYNYLTYEGKSLPTIRSLDREDRVLMVGTFSKILGTGFRVGWIIGGDHVLRKIINMKQPIDFCAPTLSQYIAYEYLRRGYFEKYHLKALKKYREKRDVLVNSLIDYLPDVRFIKPIAGMFSMMFLPENGDGNIFAEKLLEKYHVATVPGKPFYIDNSGYNTVRLNFSRPDIEDIRDGILRLSKLYHELFK